MGKELTVEPSCKFVKFVSQSISRLRKLRVGLLVNFGSDILEWERVIL